MSLVKMGLLALGAIGAVAVGYTIGVTVTVVNVLVPYGTRQEELGELISQISNEIQGGLSETDTVVAAVLISDINSIDVREMTDAEYELALESFKRRITHLMS